MRRQLQRYLPSPSQVRQIPLGPLRGRLAEPRLWHLNRGSVTAAIAVGLFMAFMPVPFQMLLSAAAAVILRCNVPVAVAVVWITNPITIPPIFFACYQLGAWLTGTPPSPTGVAMDMDWLGNQLAAIWQPFLLGCFTAGILAAALGALTINLLWRLHIITRWRERRLKRAARRAPAPAPPVPPAAKD